MFLFLYTVVSVAKSCLILCNPMDCSPPGTLSMEFSRLEYWSGLLFPPPGDLPDPRRIESMSSMSSALVGRFFMTEPPGRIHIQYTHH